MLTEGDPRGRPFKTPINPEVSYDDAMQLFAGLRAIRLAAKPSVPLSEIEVYTGLQIVQLSNFEKLQKMPKKPETLRSLASRIIGWSVPLSTTQKEYEEPIKKRNEEYRNYHSKRRHQRDLSQDTPNSNVVK